MRFTKDEAERVAEENFKLIHFVAQKFNNGQIEYDELVSVGSSGFARAIKTFDKSKGFMFSTFAVTCISNAIKNFIARESKHLDGDVSANLPLSIEEGLTLRDTLANPIAEGLEVEADIMLREDKGQLIWAISQLHPRERELIYHRYGLGGRKSKTQEEVGKMMNRSQPAISKMEAQIYEKLKVLLEGKLKLESSTYYDKGILDPIQYL